MSPKPKIKQFGRDLWKPLLTYGGFHEKRYGPATTMEAAFNRAKKEFDLQRKRELVLKGILYEHDQHMKEIEAKRPLRVRFA